MIKSLDIKPKYLSYYGLIEDYLLQRLEQRSGVDSYNEESYPLLF